MSGWEPGEGWHRWHRARMAAHHAVQHEAEAARLATEALSWPEDESPDLEIASFVMRDVDDSRRLWAESACWLLAWVLT